VVGKHRAQPLAEPGHPLVNLALNMLQRPAAPEHRLRGQGAGRLIHRQDGEIETHAPIIHNPTPGALPGKRCLLRH
jgi:hypothetical protein